MRFLRIALAILCLASAPFASADSSSSSSASALVTTVSSSPSARLFSSSLTSILHPTPPPGRTSSPFLIPSSSSSSSSSFSSFPPSSTGAQPSAPFQIPSSSSPPSSTGVEPSPSASSSSGLAWEGVVLGVLVFVCVLAGYLLYRYVDWRRCVERLSGRPLHEAYPLGSTSTESLMSGNGDSSSRLVV